MSRLSSIQLTRFCFHLLVHNQSDNCIFVAVVFDLEVMTATSGFNLENVLEKLPNEGFLTLHNAFGTGVTEESFVSILFEECARNDRSVLEDERGLHFKSLLRQLFTIIDVNSNGTVSWEEFSHYIMYAVQAPEITEKKEIVQHMAFEYLGRCPIDSTRLRSAHVEFSRVWDKYVLLECGASSSRLALFAKHNGSDNPYRVYAEYRTPTLIESVAFVDTLRALAATTTNGKLQFFSVSEDPVLEEAGHMQRLTKFREHHLDGRHTVLRFDDETKLLFAGSRDGIVTIVNPEDDTRVVPAIVQQVRLHRQPVLDLCVLPERGNKKMLTSALDGKLQMYDIVRSEFYGELGSGIAAQSMTFCDEYSVLTTCSNKDLDPLLWAPHAVSNVYVGRLESTRPSQRCRLVQAVCPKGTPYCFTADVAGQIKLWDLRKLRQVYTFFADGDVAKNELSAQLTLRSLAADPRTMDISTFCRSEFGNGLEFCKSKLVSSRDPLTTHDDHVVGLAVTTESTGTFLTASEDCVKIWSRQDGEVHHHFKNLLPEGERITSLAADDEGRRVYLGTLRGSLIAVSTATCGMIGEGVKHADAIVSLSLIGGTLFALSVDGAVSATDISGDEPTLLFTCRREIESKGMCMDVSRNFSCIVVGFENGQMELNDCAEHSHGAAMGRIKAVEATRSSLEDDEVNQYMTPAKAEISTVKVCAPRAFVCYGDTRGTLGIVAIRPHPKAMTRFCTWKTFFPKSNSTFFAVALSIEWKEENALLVVGDDQGNVTMWDCSEVLERYCFVSCAFPAPMKALMALPKPTEAPLVFAPKLRGYFTLSPTLTPIRMLRMISDNIFAMVDEKCVYFGNLNGDHCGALQQGRGTVLGGLCDPLQLEGSLRQPQEEDDSAPTGLVSAASISILQSSTSRIEGAFTCITQEEYVDMCQAFRRRDASQRTTGKLTVQDETAFNAPSPPPSPHPHFRLRSRVLSKYPRAVSPISAIGGELEPYERYYNPLKETYARDSTPMSQPNMIPRECEAVPPCHFVEEVAARLRKEVDEAVSHNCRCNATVIVSTRAAPLPLRPPTLAAVFSSDLSSTADWKARLMQQPHKSVWIQEAVTEFQSTVSAAPKESLAAHTLSDVSQQFDASSSRKTPLGGRNLSRTSFSSCRSFVKKRSELQPRLHLPDLEEISRADSEPSKPSITDFQMPTKASLNTDEHNDILRSVAAKVQEAYEKRVKSDARHQRVSTADSSRRALESLRLTHCSESRAAAPIVNSVELPKRAPTPTIGFGVSVMPPRPASSWSSVLGPIGGRRTPPPAERHSRPASQGSQRRASQSASSLERRDYVQFLMHMPRIKESLRQQANAL